MNLSLRRLLYLMSVIVATALACNLPRVSDTTPTATAATATLTPGPSPTTPAPLLPAVVETHPLAGGVLSLKGPLTLFFNQAMDRRSVEASLIGQPPLSGRFLWLDEATLQFYPDSPFPAEADLTVEIGTSAQAANGLALPAPVHLGFITAGPLRLSQSLPEPESIDVNPSAAVVAAFNRPVVALGAEPDSLPAAFSLEPHAKGNGVWINTSTYIFYPQPPLAGGSVYSVFLNPELHSTDGSPLVLEGDPPGQSVWTFTTSLPQLVRLDPPDAATDIPLDASISLSFNQPMDPESVTEGFTLLHPSGSVVEGTINWEDDFSTLTFTPGELLERDLTYVLSLFAGARSQGGTPLSASLETSFHTVSPLAILGTTPSPGGLTPVFSSLEIAFNAPLQEGKLEQYIDFEPALPGLAAHWNQDLRVLHLWGEFDPSTNYRLTISRQLADRWGGTLKDDFTFSFRTEPLRPEFFLVTSTSAVFVPLKDPRLAIQATNLDRVNLSLGEVSLADFIRLLGPGSYDALQNFQPSNPMSWVWGLNLPDNRSQTIDLLLADSRRELTTGLYLLKATSPGLAFSPGPYLLVLSDVHLTFKASATDALVWAVDLERYQPIPGGTVSIYAEDGNLLTRGKTDSQGLFRAPLPAESEPFGNTYAVLDDPGMATFGLAVSSWDQGVAGWDFGIGTDFSPPGLKAYLYTDRPIYRPGQTVYYRAVLRWKSNGRYSDPGVLEVPVTIYDDQGLQLETHQLSLTPFGTASGAYHLPENARPGYYRLSTPHGDLFFQVAEFRKPEVDLEVALTPIQVLSGEILSGEINGRFFSGAPAGDAPVDWALYRRPDDLYLPGYQVGLLGTHWLFPAWPGLEGPLGELVTSGQGQLGKDGRLLLDLPTEKQDMLYRYTLEATLQDESGFPVTARAEALVHPGQVYYGIQPGAWVGQAGREIIFEVQTVDWSRSPLADQLIQLDFQKVVWERQETDPGDPFAFPRYIPSYTPIAHAAATSNADGQVSMGFIPPEPGAYQLEAQGQGGRTQVIVWVGGQGQAIWPSLPNQHLRLTADRESYQPGESAQIFIPNPFPKGTQALITVERGMVMRHQIITLNDSGNTYIMPVTHEDTPNVYVSVTILGEGEGNRPDFRQGYINLPVEPREHTLQVSLTSQSDKVGPGEAVNFGLRVTDQSGQPVRAEFSLSLVDLATLKLADPNAPGIVTAFYGQQPLGVRTGLGLVAYAGRSILAPPGQGGGGGGFPAPLIREEFQDTAFWDPTIVTDENGEARVTVNLPDNLTTWEVEVRGLTRDTRVGQAEGRVMATKDLLVRPITPRFMVVGDHLELAAVIHNNTRVELDAEVVLQAKGFSPDNPGDLSQKITLPAMGRIRISWWGTVEDVAGVDLVFSARSHTAASPDGQILEDATRPPQGSIPVLRYSAPQTFASAGSISEAGERLELVTIPRTFTPTGGELSVELAPSLAAAMTDALEALEHTPYECTEQTLSRFLPNLEALRAVQTLGMDAPAMQARLDRTLDTGLSRLIAAQNPDGGWGWCPGTSLEPASDPYMTSYVLFGLSRAKEAGARVDRAILLRAADYLLATLPSPQMLTESWQLDRLVFQHFALAEAGVGDPSGAANIYEVRHQLNPWAQGLLALTLEKSLPGDERARALLSDLQTTAQRSSTGVHWPERTPGWQNMSSPLFNTAVVVYSLARRDPAAPLIADAVRFLMTQRQADVAWGSTFANAWAIMALTEVMSGTGEFGGDYRYSATLDGIPLAEGSSESSPLLTPVRVNVPLESLSPRGTSALRIRREPGPGRLYYRAFLRLDRPVDDLEPFERGVSISRKYHPVGFDCPGEGCVDLATSGVGDQILVRLTFTLEDDAYYFLVEDFLPAGAEVLDVGLKTSQQGALPGRESVADYDPQRPFDRGWGWWYFGEPHIFDERIAWTADILPAGTYELTYTLSLLQPGEFHVLPARAWQYYFPDVQGSSSGSLLTIKPQR